MKLREWKENKRKRAISVLDKIEKREVLTWDEDFRVYYKGKLIPSSNILTLLSYAVGVSKKNKKKPKGIHIFNKVLHKKRKHAKTRMGEVSEKNVL